MLVESLLALVLVCLLVMSGAWFQRQLRGHLIARLADATGGRVEIGSFRFKPWLLQITLQNLVIHGSEPAGELPLLSVREADAVVNPLTILGRGVRLRSLDVDSLRIHIRTSADGASNLPDVSGQDLNELTDLSIRRLTVAHSAFFWNDQRQPVALTAGDLAILLHANRGHYTGSISSSALGIRSVRWPFPPVTFNSRFDLSPASLVFSSFAWQADGTSGEASFAVLPRLDWRASGRFHASLDVKRLGTILHAPDLRAGSLQIEGLAAYEDGKLSARGRAEGRRFMLADPSLPPLLMDATTNYDFENGLLHLTGLVASFWGGTVQGALQANLQKSPVEFRLSSHLYHLRLENILQAAKAHSLLASPLRPAAATDGSLNATWSGPGNGLKADFDVSLRPPATSSPGQLPVSGTVRGALENVQGLQLELADADLHTPHSSIRARGSLAERGRTGSAALALSAATDDFEECRPILTALMNARSEVPLQLMSRAEVSGQLSGSIEAPFFAGRLNLGRFRYQGWTWDRLSAAVTLNPTLIRVADAQVQHDKSSLQLNTSVQLANWRLTPESLLRVSVVAHHTPLEGLRAALNSDIPIRGSASGRLDAEGTSANLAGSGSLEIDDGAFADEPFDSFSTRLQVTRSIWKLNDVRLSKASGRLRGDITVEPGRRFASGQLTGTHFRLADMHRLPGVASIGQPEDKLEGNLNFQAQGQGTPGDFHVQSAWQIHDLSVRNTPPGEFAGTLTGEGNVLKLEGANQDAGERKLHFSAQTTAQGDWPMEANGEYSGLRVDPWIRAFFNRQFGAAATLDGSFRAKGSLREISKISVEAHTAEFALEFPSMQWRNVQPVDVQYSGGRLTLSPFTMRGPATELGIAGTVDFADQLKLAISAEGTASATILTLFDPTVQATGQSILHARLTGTPNRPLLNGSVEVQDASLAFQGLPLRFNGVQGTISLEGERANIRSMHGTSGGGKVAFSGFTTLAENPRFEVRTDLEQVRIPYPSGFTSVLDGHLRLVGSTERAEVQGDMEIRQMIPVPHFNIVNNVIESPNPLSALPAPSSSPLASRIRMNVRVTSTPPVQIQTPDFRMLCDVDVRLQGTVADMAQVGTIHILNGESVFRGNRFTVVRGDINMTNPFRTQAVLDLEAQTRVQNYDLTLDITGPFDRLKFAYRSDPPLSQPDIISLLALGYVPQEQAFPALQGNPTSSVGASAILSQALSSQIGGRIQHLFGVSRIKIDPYVGMPGFGSGERVTVEERITHELTLTYITDTSYSQYTIVQFEWNVTNNMSILGVRDPNGIFGLEFRFRSRFK